MSELQKDFPLSKQAAAGIVGNVSWECGDFKTLQEIKPTVKGSKGGYGWCQWTGPRRREFEKWAKIEGLELSSREANYGFLKHELTHTSEKRVIDRLKGVTSVTKATEIFCNTFLRPGIPHLEKRVKRAHDYFEAGEDENVA